MNRGHIYCYIAKLSDPKVVCGLLEGHLVMHLLTLTIVGTC
ncbi:hypothetical protein Hdeb2414_s0006g00194471 [Helianthus debilis subsp. tardiflorus]